MNNLFFLSKNSAYINLLIERHVLHNLVLYTLEEGIFILNFPVSAVFVLLFKRLWKLVVDEYDNIHGN